MLFYENNTHMKQSYHPKTGYSITTPSEVYYSSYSTAICQRLQCSFINKLHVTHFTDYN